MNDCDESRWGVIMNVLFVAIDDLRWGPVRLPKFMDAAGFRVAALCPSSNPLAYTKFTEQVFDLPRTKSAPRMAAALRHAMQAWQPALVIPADEMVFSLLRSLLVDTSAGTGAHGLTDTMRAVLERSLGDAAQRDAMLFKNDTQQLAARIGVRVPAGRAVSSAEDAALAASGLGYPVVVKSSYGWGGAGVRVCDTPEQLIRAYEDMGPRDIRPDAAKAFILQRLRRLLGRDWYPEPQQLWVQSRIVGDPAMYTFSAVEGRMLAGFAGIPCTTSTAVGHSTVVDCGPHPEMAAASASMVAALGITGFASFDFMIERSTGASYLLECNPRPTQVSHLGRRLDVDLCAALHAALVERFDQRPDAGRCQYRETLAHTAQTSARRETIALFPQEWARAHDSRALHDLYHDVPWDDPGLVARVAQLVAHPAGKREPRPKLTDTFKFSLVAKRFF